MTAASVLAELERAGVRAVVVFEPECERLYLRPIPPPALLEAVRRHKAEIIEWMCGPNDLADELADPGFHAEMQAARRRCGLHLPEPVGDRHEPHPDWGCEVPPPGSLARRDWLAGKPPRYPPVRRPESAQETRGGNRGDDHTLRTRARAESAGEAPRAKELRT
jgi:hypothetical protein